MSANCDFLSILVILLVKLNAIDTVAMPLQVDGSSHSRIPVPVQVRPSLVHLFPVLFFERKVLADTPSTNRSREPANCAIVMISAKEGFPPYELIGFCIMPSP